MNRYFPIIYCVYIPYVFFLWKKSYRKFKRNNKNFISVCMYVFLYQDNEKYIMKNISFF